MQWPRPELWYTWGVLPILSAQAAREILAVWRRLPYLLQHASSSAGHLPLPTACFTLTASTPSPPSPPSTAFVTGGSAGQVAAGVIFGFLLPAVMLGGALYLVIRRLVLEPQVPL